MTIDRSSWLWRKGRPLAVSLGVLLAMGYLLQPLQNTAWQEVRSRQPELNLKDLGESLGQGTLLGVLGGFRSILADFIWIQQYSFWEKHDRPDTEAYTQLAARMDPHNLMFWDEGSSIIGLDIPAWQIRQLPEPTTDEEVKLYQAARNKIYREQALRAVDFLDSGLKFLPDNYTLLKDQAQIYFNRLNDMPHAAEKFRLAAENTTSPFYAARCYIRALRQIGRNQEAYDYMRKFYPTLPDNLPEAQKNLMWGWVRGLEDVLHVPPGQRLPDSLAPPNWNAKDYMDDFNDLSTTPLSF